MSDQPYADLCFGVDLADIDPAIDLIIDLEEERQRRRIILIPSESMSPLAVRQALGSVFNNVYAEGYPPLRMTREEEQTLLDFGHQLTHYRRYADRRFYKGVDYVHFVEALAQRRCAALFANDLVSAGNIHVNVQPLSGAAANLAVYDAFMETGDVLMGMDLFQGGHLTHGSEFNVSGKRYRVASYGVSKATGQLDYDQIGDVAREYRPRIIVAGYTSYPWAPDWEKFRAIADEVGALLVADIAHTAGMAAAGIYPNPVGIADVVTFTTHKTIAGPRGAVIMTTDEDMAQAIDMAVFPGAQGGPHTNKFAAIAVAFHIARTDCFSDLQQRIVDNAQALAKGLTDRGLRLAYGGTDTHLLMLDLNAIETRTGFPLRGEMAARILDLGGIVTNKNTIPGDELTALAMGLRLGTPWVSQRGMGPAEMDEIAGLIHDIVTNIQPFAYQGLVGELPRGKIDMDILEGVRCAVDELASGARAETATGTSTYPHYSLAADVPGPDGRGLLLVRGSRAEPFLQQVGTANVSGLQAGDRIRSLLLNRDGTLLDDVHILRLDDDSAGRRRYVVATTPGNHQRVTAWFRALSDGYVLFDDEDIFRKVEGPVTVVDVLSDVEEDDAVRQTALAFGDGLEGFDVGPITGDDALSLFKAHPDLFALGKPYFVGQKALDGVHPDVKKGEWSWEEKEGALRRTPLYDTHKRLTKKVIPFAGWEMPVWYTSVSDEHRAVRQAAGLFDVAHMGVLEIAGPYAVHFLDIVTSNYVRWLGDGESHYSYLPDPDGNLIDDVMVYRRRQDLYLMVVNAANADKDWDWLNAVNEGDVLIDREHPDKRPEGKAILRDLKDPKEGARQRVDIALQGPASLAILQRLADDPKQKAALARVRRTDLVECELAGLDLIVARTGYCGEEVGYEIFVHPDDAVTLWELILERGAELGVKPAGLGARDSTRTEAGLPLYGHELAGPFSISPGEAGFPGYVKFHKPYFIGRRALLERDLKREKEVVRFRMNEKGVRLPKTGDPLVNRRGRYIGAVTSCAINSQGYLLGLAYVDKRYNRPGESIAIFALPPKTPPAKPFDELGRGDQVLLPDAATVLTRFPEDEKKAGWRARGGE